MTKEEYLAYYQDLTRGALGGGHAHFAITDEDGQRRPEFDNLRRGLTVLALISLIESRFLIRQPRGTMRRLRNFQPVLTLASTIDQRRLSCYIYIRDCFGHDPRAKLFPSTQPNTIEFESAIVDGLFPFATIEKSAIKIVDTHALHQIVLGFFDEYA